MASARRWGSKFAGPRWVDGEDDEVNRDLIPFRQRRQGDEQM